MTESPTPCWPLELSDKAQLSGNAEKEMRRLLEHLAGGKIPQGYLHYAQSVIVRSELSAYGVSSARFAVRFSFGGGFVNLRRLRLLEKVLNQSYPKGFSRPRVKGWKNVNVRDLHICRQPSVADSFLTPPQRYPWKEFYHVARPALVEFGETQPNGAMALYGSPYVRTPNFGVGVCAEACCFVATLLQQPYASRVCGLGEISALASGRDHILKITGLEIQQMVAYFSAVNLRTIAQTQRATVKQGRRSHDFELALHSYIASRMPVVVCLDSTSLLPPQSVQKGPSHHAITVLGCSRWRRLDRAGSAADAPNGKTRFLYHDSTELPYTEITADKLMAAGMPYDAAQSDTLPRKILSKLKLRKSSVDKATRRFPDLLPVTPREVTIPLLTWSQEPPNRMQQITGAEMSSYLRRGLLEFSASPWDKPSGTGLGIQEFRLLQINNAWLRLLEFFPASERDLVSKWLSPDFLCAEVLTRFGWDETHWVWFEILTSTPAGKRNDPSNIEIKLWDAEVDPQVFADNDRGAILRGVLKKETTAREWTWQWDPFGKSKRPVLSKNLEPSIISSFELSGIKLAQGLLPVEAKYVEYYACVKEDLKHYFPKHNNLENALHVLAACEGDPGLAEQFANQLRADVSGRTIMGFATFLPEITASNEDLAEKAVKALLFLVETAGHLRKTDSHPFIIEMVAGSTVQGFGYKKSKASLFGDGKDFAVDRRQTDECIELLLSRLDAVAKKAFVLRNVFFALELEPGPLFLLNDQVPLSRFYRALMASDSEAVRSVVGFNLDIPHWAFLTDQNVTVAWLNSHPQIRDRIVHAHISDHGLGHLCDLELGLKHGLPEFEPWLELLRQRANCQPNTAKGIMPFSGFVSLEHEACNSRDQLLASFETLMNWCK